MEYFLNDHKLHLNPISPLTDSQSMPKAELRKAPKEGFCSHCLLALGSHPTRRTVNGEDHGFCCYGCCLAFQVKHGSREEPEAAWLLIRLGTGGFLAMNIMLFSLLLYSGTFNYADAELIPLIHWILGIFATPVMLILGWPFFHETWDGLLQGRLTSSTLISLGAGAAYAYSVLMLFTGGSHIYFDTATMVLVLFTVGRYLEAAGRASFSTSGSSWHVRASTSGRKNTCGRNNNRRMFIC